MLIDKIEFDGIDVKLIQDLKEPNCLNLYKIAAKFSDGIVFENNFSNTNIFDPIKGVPRLESQEHSEYFNFYQNFFSEELV